MKPEIARIAAEASERAKIEAEVRSRERAKIEAEVRSRERSDTANRKTGARLRLKRGRGLR